MLLLLIHYMHLNVFHDLFSYICQEWDLPPNELCLTEAASYSTCPLSVPGAHGDSENANSRAARNRDQEGRQKFAVCKFLVANYSREAENSKRYVNWIWFSGRVYILRVKWFSNMHLKPLYCHILLSVHELNYFMQVIQMHCNLEANEEGTRSHVS